MKNEVVIKGSVIVEYIRYYKNEWGILIVSPKSFKDPQPICDDMGRFCLKGSMLDPTIGAEYEIIAKQVIDPKYGLQYEIMSMATSFSIDESNEGAKRRFLEYLFTDTQIQNMYEALEDPYTALKEKDFVSLLKVRGCAEYTAARWIDKFETNLAISRLYLELSDCALTPSAMRKLLDSYGSPDIVIGKIKDNPYCLTEVDGFGFKRTDQIAMGMGITEFDQRRIGAFIYYVLNEAGELGRSFISTDELMDRIVEYFGDDITDLAIASTMHSKYIEDRIWYNEDKSYIGLKKYETLEQKIADEIYRLVTAESEVDCSGWEEKIQQIEREQGWQYTEQQKLGIKTIAENNLVIIEGNAGTGKTSTATGIIKAFDGFSYALTAFAGKAAMRLGEVTGYGNGQTIHRLLGYNPVNGFVYDNDNPLDYDVVIVDEISMIGGELFYYLLRSIKSGCKLILLGDTGQLEAIGSCNVASDLIQSGLVPVVTLDKIHRQAAKSAIITESLRVRYGDQIVPKDWVGCETRGELQDLTIECFSDISNTYYVIMNHFKDELKRLNGDISKIQVICPVKQRGSANTWLINNEIQNLYNPDRGQGSIEVYYAQRGKGVLRVGDKVINTKNNYRAMDTNGKTVAIFNGNMGTIKSIDVDNDIVIIDFYQVGEIVLSTTGLGAIELGYAITTHKFQGSQAEVVIFGIDFSSYSLLTKELVYTGITRAQKKCILVAQTGALRFAIGTAGVSKKQTHLKRLLYEKFTPTSTKIVF